MTSSATSYTDQIALLEFNSYSNALSVMNSFVVQQKAHIFEIIPRANSTSVLLGFSGVLLAQQNLLDKSIQRIEIIDLPHPKLLNVYLNQEMNSVRDFLVCWESDSVGALLSAADRALKMGLLPIEFRYSRSGSGAGFILFTGSTEQSGEVKSKLLWKDVRGNMIEKPSSQICDLFKFSV